MNWKIFLAHPDAKLPTQEPESAGFDLYCVSDESFIPYDSLIGELYQKNHNLKMLKPGESHLFHTGLKCSFDKDYVAILYDRSGMAAKHGIHILAGVIDSSYRGEWKVCLTNLSDREYGFYAGDKIIQVIFYQLPKVKWGVVSSEQMLGQTIRGVGGFGSSGK